MDIEQYFFENPVFSYQDFLSAKIESNPLIEKKKIKVTQVSRHAASKLLLYYLKTQRLKRLRKNLFAVVKPNETPENTVVDPYLIAAKAIEDSVLAYHTALELYGIAYSSFEQFTFLTNSKAKFFEVEDSRFQPVSIPSELKKNHKEKLFVETINRQGIDIRITSLARTYVDVLDKVNLSGGWEEVYRSLNSIAALNVDDVIKYCLALNNARLAAKVGYFLELRSGAFAVPEQKLKPLLKMRPRAPQYLSTTNKEPCQFNKKWNLMIPTRILNQSWEEPNVDF